MTRCRPQTYVTALFDRRLAQRSIDRNVASSMHCFVTGGCHAKNRGRPREREQATQHLAHRLQRTRVRVATRRTRQVPVRVDLSLDREPDRGGPLGVLGRSGVVHW